jgi:hypothetical protein
MRDAEASGAGTDLSGDTDAPRIEAEAPSDADAQSDGTTPPRDGTRAPRTVDRSPARLGRVASVGAGLLALVSTGLYSWPALAAGSLGLSLLLVGLVRGANGPVSGGAFSLFLGAVLAGAGGAPVLRTLVGVTAAVLAWDVGGNAIGVGAQLGREADTTRLEAVHVASSVAVGAAVAGAGFGLYRLGTGEQPTAVLVLLAVAAVLLVEALS